ncbi:glycosyltransferase family 1 protein (plasmid) [Rhizobium gallicum]|uniref:Glycosyltransferase family 1 protein n=1 Tax=Rhizobium gallicum TaxID=56730 RepID=A0A1L5NUA2_9HYPH|nr:MULTISPECIES: glycosyltransferase family 4 protein [Rhizobium]APO71472.1 glycosyltransferase family 1 protein [Rhizobium gallicum]QPB23277.1 glycosyltransferase family 4 protein [Rhizobium sp. 007]
MGSKPIVVVYPFVGDEFGGSNISAIKLIEALQPSEVRPVVVLHRPNGDFAKYLDKRQIEYLTVKASVLRSRYRGATGSAVAAGYLYTVARLIRFLRRQKADIVHTNDGSIHATWGLPTVFSGARLLWHHRGDPAARGINFLAPLIASHIVTVSNYAKPTSPLLPISARTSVIHSPFDHPEPLLDREECRMDLVRELGLDENTRLIGFFATLIDRKRPIRFVEAIHAFCAQHPELTVAGLLFGSPKHHGQRLDVEVTARARELGIEKAIHLMGFRSPINRLMCAMDILLVPAINEPFGRTLIEAMLLGTPVVATNHGGNPEAIVDGETGYLVEPEVPSAFVPPMAKLLKDPSEWQRVSGNAQKSALARYGIRPHTEQIMHIYRQLAGRTA